MPRKGKIIRQEKLEEGRKEINTVVSILLSAHARTSQAEYMGKYVYFARGPIRTVYDRSEDCEMHDLQAALWSALW